MDIRYILLVFCFVYLFICVFSLPVTNNEKKSEKEKPNENELKENEEKIDKEIDDLGLEYGRYLQQVVEALEQDKEFAKKLENVSQDEIKNGVIAKELDFVNHNVRNQLDELKRIEMDRLRQLARREQQLQEGRGGGIETDDGRRWRTLGADSKAISLDAQHLDHLNPHSFEAEDLQKLILSATKDLEALDEKRKEDFKSYEMEKELRYREALVNMTEEERKKTIENHEKMEEEHKRHPKVHHPGSKKQLEQVWEEQDHMPREEFNPKVFFTMHDVNGDGFLDPQEVEAILSVEIRKMYSEKNPEDDVNEMQEEYHRMREHIYKEADLNRDGLISKKEFLDFTHRMEFERDDGWKGLDEEKVYSEEDLKKFQEKERKQYEERQQYMAYQQQYQPNYYPQQQQLGGHPQQQQQYYGQHYGEQPHHYIPPPNQMSQQEWQQQQQYYGVHPNQQYVVLQQPNPQLHPQQQQQQLLQHQQQQQQLHPQQQQALHQQQQQQQALHQINGINSVNNVNSVPQLGGQQQQQQNQQHLSQPSPQLQQQSHERRQ